MNKILPIILVVVLSGCGGATKTALENCADKKLQADKEVALAIKGENLYDKET